MCRDHKLREVHVVASIPTPSFFLTTPHCCPAISFTVSLVSLKGKTPVPAGEEEGELGEYRQKLLMFLEISSYYDPGRLICDFPFDGEYLGPEDTSVEGNTDTDLSLLLVPKPSKKLDLENTICFRPVLLSVASEDLTFVP